MALNEFMEWFQQAPRPGFTKATVQAWRVSLEERGLGSSSIIIRMSAIRKLAAEAADNGLLSACLALYHPLLSNRFCVRSVRSLLSSFSVCQRRMSWGCDGAAIMSSRS
jgi:hypothetical protein